MQSVKIASVAGIVKRPTPDESQPRWMLLPGRTATFQHLQRCSWVFEYTFSFCAAISPPPEEYHRLAEFTVSPHRDLHLICQRPVALKTLRSLTWSILCTCLLVISRSVLFLFFFLTSERVWKRDSDRCCCKWCNQKILKASKSFIVIQIQPNKISCT